MSIPWGGKYSIVIYQGAGFEEVFELYDILSDGQPDLDSPINFITDTEAVAQARKKEARDSELIVEFAVTIEDNKLTLKLTDDETSDISIFSGYYDVFVTEPGAEAQMFVEGKVIVNKAVTLEPEP